MSDSGSHAAQTGIPEITIGTRITNYGGNDITVSGMASGGMGLVAWGPNRARGGQMLAVKLPKPDRLAAASRAQRAAILADFEREALTWCHLWAHPCIVAAESLLRLRGLGGLPAIFLEYAPNGSLRDRLNIVHRLGSTQALGLQAVFAWGQMIAAALATIHQPDSALERPDPLVHCDLKPENVLLDERGWALLTDLGLTRALASLADTILLSPVATRASGVVDDEGSHASRPGRVERGTTGAGSTTTALAGPGRRRLAPERHGCCPLYHIHLWTARWCALWYPHYLYFPCPASRPRQRAALPHQARLPNRVRLSCLRSHLVRRR